MRREKCRSKFGVFHGIEVWNKRSTRAAGVFGNAGSVIETGCANMALAQHPSNVSDIYVKPSESAIVDGLDRKSVLRTQPQSATRLGRKAQATVLTVATPDYANQWRFCLDSQRRYCDRAGLKHCVIDPSRLSLHPKWAKLSLALEILDYCDVLVVDADTEIAADCPSFETMFYEHEERDFLFVKGISGRPNSGVLMLRCGSDSVASAFSRECLARKERPVPAEDFVTAEGENGHVIFVLKDPLFAQRSAELPRVWNCSDPSLAQTAYIRHYTNLLRKWLRDQHKATE